MKELILGIDFNNMIFAGSFGEELINSHGVNVNCVKSFFFKLKKIREFLNPNYIVIATDLGRTKTFRRKLYSEYKATRTETAINIREQMDIALQLLAQLGYPIINNVEYEADDMLGAISRLGMDHQMDTTLCTSDRDYYQLINDQVTVFSTRKNEIIDKDWIQQEYQVTPEQLIDVKALAGDKGDNIPGARGIGEITALQLIREYGSLDGVYNNLYYIKPRVRDTLIVCKKQVELSKVLGTIIIDYNQLGLTLDSIQFKPPFYDDVMRTLYHHGLPSLTNAFQYSLFPDNFIHETAV